MSIRDLIRQIAERRRTSRIPAQGLAAYYWTGGIPKPRDVRDIGLHGAYVVAPDFFYPGTLVQIVLENRADGHGDGQGIPSIAVTAEVCRQTPEGFGVAFSFGDSSERRQLRRFLEGLTRQGQVEAAPAGSDEPNTAVQPADTVAAEEAPCAPDQVEAAPRQDQPAITDGPVIEPGEQNERKPAEGHVANERRLASGQGR